MNKKLIFVSACLCIATFLSGQVSFDLGGKFAFGPTVMFNQNIFDDGDYEHKATFGTAYGGKLGLNLGYHGGFTFDYIVSKSAQDFEFDLGQLSNQTNDFEWKHHDLLLLYRYSGNGAFIEFGPKYTIMKEVNQEYIGNPPATVTDLFSENYLSAVFGFGSYLFGGETWSIDLGVRLHYALDDMINDKGRAANYPTLNYPIIYDPYKKTRDVTVQVSVDFNYTFGRFAKERCSTRWKLILFE